MSAGTVYREKRKHRRFSAREGAFVATNDNLCLIGQLVDISIGGMCFRYIAGDATLSSCALDIFVSDQRFYLPNIPYQIVSNTVLDPEVEMSSIPICQCRVKFVNLTDAQQSSLLNLINCHTIH